MLGCCISSQIRGGKGPWGGAEGQPLPPSLPPSGHLTWISRAWYMMISPSRMAVERLMRHFRAKEYEESWQRGKGGGRVRQEGSPPATEGFLWVALSHFGGRQVMGRGWSQGNILALQGVTGAVLVGYSPRETPSDLPSLGWHPAVKGGREEPGKGGDRRRRGASPEQSLADPRTQA